MAWVLDPKTGKNVNLPLETPSSQSTTPGLTAEELSVTTVPVTASSGGFYPSDASDIATLLASILTELRVISFVLNEGLNTREDLDVLREDEESDQE